MRSTRKQKSVRAVAVQRKLEVVNVDELAEKYEDFLAARSSQILNIATELRNNSLTRRSEQEFNHALLNRYFEIVKTKQRGQVKQAEQVVETPKVRLANIANVKPSLKHTLAREELMQEGVKTGTTHIETLNSQIVLKESISKERAYQEKAAETEYEREVLEFAYSAPEAIEFSTQPVAHVFETRQRYVKPALAQASALEVRGYESEQIEPAKTEAKTEVVFNTYVAPAVATRQASSVQARAKQASTAPVASTKQAGKEVQTAKSLEAVVEQTDVLAESLTEALSLTEELAYELTAPLTYSVETQASEGYAKEAEIETDYEANPLAPTPTNSIAKIVKINPRKQRPRIVISIPEQEITNQQLEDMTYERAKGAKGFYCKAEEVQDGISRRGDSEHPTQDLYVLKNKDGSVIEGTYSLFGKPLRITEDDVRYAGSRSVSGLDKNDRTTDIDLKGLQSILYEALEEKGLSTVCKSMFTNKNVYFEKIEEITKQYLKVHPDAKREQLGYLIVEVDPLTGKLSEPGYNPETGLQYTPRVGEHYAILISNGKDISEARVEIGGASYRGAGESFIHYPNRSAQLAAA